LVMFSLAIGRVLRRRHIVHCPAVAATPAAIVRPHACGPAHRHAGRSSR
jgi:hypothetical protein